MFLQQLPDMSVEVSPAEEEGSNTGEAAPNRHFSYVRAVINVGPGGSSLQRKCPAYTEQGYCTLVHTSLFPCVGVPPGG